MAKEANNFVQSTEVGQTYGLASVDASVIQGMTDFKLMDHTAILANTAASVFSH